MGAPIVHELADRLAVLRVSAAAPELAAAARSSSS
jgi:hypothetical protein